MVTLNGRRGIVDLEPSTYPRNPKKRRIHFADGDSEWVLIDELVKLHEQFIGMPNEYNFPEFGNPILSWQEIPHEWDEYLTWEGNPGCLYCGLPESAQIHITAPE